MSCALVLAEPGPVRPSPVQDAVAVHDAVRAAYTFFKNKFSRDGYDDQGHGGSAGSEPDHQHVFVFDFEHYRIFKLLSATTAHSTPRM